MKRAVSQGGDPIQINELTTKNYSCPAGSLQELVARVQSKGEHESEIYACRDVLAPITGTTKSSYGGMFQQRIDGECVIGNRATNLSVTEAPILTPERDARYMYTGRYKIIKGSIVDNSKNYYGAPRNYSCSCPIGYVPMPIANIATASAKRSVLWLCQDQQTVPSSIYPKQ